MLRVEQKITRTAVENDDNLLNEKIEITKSIFGIVYKREISDLTYDLTLEEGKTNNKRQVGFVGR